MADTVRAAVQVGPRTIEIREFPRPVIGPDDGLLRVEANGICGSDVESYRGHLRMGGGGPTVPGHEPLGIIEEIGERAAERWGVQPGDRVALVVIVPCRSCHKTTNAPNRVAFEEFLQAQMAAIGITLQPRFFDLAQFSSSVVQSQDFQLAGMVGRPADAPYPSAQNVLRTGGNQNYGGYSNPEVKGVVRYLTRDMFFATAWLDR